MRCRYCHQGYYSEDSDARSYTTFCSRDCESDCEADETSEHEDTGRYSSGYRVYRDGSYREDFGSDR